MSGEQFESAIKAQQREVLNRLHETEMNPDALESFEENDLERMIRDATGKKAQTGRN